MYGELSNRNELAEAAIKELVLDKLVDVKIEEGYQFKMRTVIPCNTELLKEKDIASDPLVQAQNDTFNNTSILQPFVASMSNCWTPVENMGKGIRNKSVTHENAEEQTEAMNEAMNSNGIN